MRRAKFSCHTERVLEEICECRIPKRYMLLIVCPSSDAFTKRREGKINVLGLFEPLSSCSRSADTLRSGQVNLHLD